MIDENTISRFWDKVDKRGPDDCWEWTAATKRHGYGALYRSQEHSPWDSHRLSWEIHNGAIPAGKSVLHKCDNPPCVNPAHLYVGTQSENVSDAWRRGRRDTKNFARGEDAGQAVLSNTDVREITGLLDAGNLLHREIAKKYGVSRQAITEINRGRTWRSVTTTETEGA